MENQKKTLILESNSKNHNLTVLYLGVLSAKMSVGFWAFSPKEMVSLLSQHYNHITDEQTVICALQQVEQPEEEIIILPEDYIIGY